MILWWLICRERSANVVCLLKETENAFFHNTTPRDICSSHFRFLNNKRVQSACDSFRLTVYYSPARFPRPLKSVRETRRHRLCWWTYAVLLLTTVEVSLTVYPQYWGFQLNAQGCDFTRLSTLSDPPNDVPLVHQTYFPR